MGAQIGLGPGAPHLCPLKRQREVSCPAPILAHNRVAFTDPQPVCRPWFKVQVRTGTLHQPKSEAEARSSQAGLGGKPSGLGWAGLGP